MNLSKLGIHLLLGQALAVDAEREYLYNFPRTKRTKVKRRDKKSRMKNKLARKKRKTNRR